MEDCECAYSDDDHNTLESNEVGLLAHELAPPSTCQFRDTVDTSGEDGGECENEAYNEAAELGIVEQPHGICGQLISVTVSSDGIFGKEISEEDKADDLEDDTSNHEI